MSQAEEIKNAINANRKVYLHGAYNEIALKLNVTYESVRSMARRMRGETLLPEQEPSFPHSENHLINYEGYALKEHMERLLRDKGQYRVMFISDVHGWLADLKALKVVNKILQTNPFDEVCLNGDIMDLPFISAHTNKLYQDGILRGYSEVEEVRYTKEQILKPLRLSTNAEIRYRLGNHENRLTNPNNVSQSQMARLAVLFKHYETTRLDEMLGLDEFNITYDPSDIFTYFQLFECVHGISLSKNAGAQNLLNYQMSGTTGHTHRLSHRFFSSRTGDHCWLESGCMRLKQQVEYFPTGIIPDWQHGIVTVTFYREGNTTFFIANAHPIVQHRTVFNGRFYNGN